MKIIILDFNDGKIKVINGIDKNLQIEEIEYILTNEYNLKLSQIEFMLVEDFEIENLN